MTLYRIRWINTMTGSTGCGIRGYPREEAERHARAFAVRDRDRPHLEYTVEPVEPVEPVGDEP